MIRGDFELADGNFRAARRLYRRAARLGPDLPEPWIGLGRLALARRDPDRARRELERALALDPMDAYARGLLDSLSRPE